MAPSALQFSPARLRSYILRLPLCTRLFLGLIVAFWAACIPFQWIRDWGALTPSKITLSTLYRLNTYPFIHIGFFHALFNLLALASLLERFEAEFGTIVTLLLFTGPFSTLPGLLYTLVERGILRWDVSVEGASIWTFLLLSYESLKTARNTPHFSLGPYKIPTWTAPLALIIVVSLLVPNSSLLGHLCGAAVGYTWGLGYIRFLVPPEKILRFVEGKLNLLGRLPHYVSVDQKTYGRYGVLPSVNAGPQATVAEGTVPMTFLGQGQRLGP